MAWKRCAAILGAMPSDVAHLLLGALLALSGGVSVELWREARANRKEVRLLQAELDAIVELCDVILESHPKLSVGPWLAHWRSFALQGSATNRSWLRAIDDAHIRSQVLQVYLRASSLVGTFEEFVAREDKFKLENDREGFYEAVASNREILAGGLLEGVKSQAQEALHLLQPLADHPLLL